MNRRQFFALIGTAFAGKAVATALPPPIKCTESFLPSNLDNVYTVKDLYVEIPSIHLAEVNAYLAQCRIFDAENYTRQYLRSLSGGSEATRMVK